MLSVQGSRSLGGCAGNDGWEYVRYGHTPDVREQILRRREFLVKHDDDVSWKRLLYSEAERFDFVVNGGAHDLWPPRLDLVCHQRSDFSGPTSSFVAVFFYHKHVEYISDRVGPLPNHDIRPVAWYADHTN